jgi:hypothetical protein
MNPTTIMGTWPLTQMDDLCGEWLSRPAETGKGLALVKTEEKPADNKH